MLISHDLRTLIEILAFKNSLGTKSLLPFHQQHMDIT